MEKIICVGEVVWDVFPDKKLLGGAPLNVAYYLSIFFDNVIFISKVGNDELGTETLQKISSIGLSTDYVQKDKKLSTGIVNISFKGKEHSFEIVEPSAWDNIEEIKIKDEFILIFGTLAQRNIKSRKTIRSLMKQASLKCYDVNLRPPYTLKQTVLDSLVLSDIVKLNNDELRVIREWLNFKGSDEEIAGKIKEKYGLKIIIVTKGSKGAFLISDKGVFEHPGFKVDVEDTIGSGDSFFATFIEGYINKRSLDNILERANQVGSYVATQKGATPSMKPVIQKLD